MNFHYFSGKNYQNQCPLTKEMVLDDFLAKLLHKFGKLRKFLKSCLILVDHFSAIFSIRGIGMVFKWPQRPISLFITIQCIEIKHLFSNIFGGCADILTFDSECSPYIVRHIQCNDEVTLQSKILPLKNIYEAKKN